MRRINRIHVDDVPEAALLLSFRKRAVVGVGFAARFSIQSTYSDLVGRSVISLMAKSLETTLMA